MNRKVNSFRPVRLMLVTSILVALAGSTTIAQWTVTSLHPNSATASGGFAVFGGQQAGWAVVSLTTACLWSGSSSTFVSLRRPMNLYDSRAYALDGQHECGSNEYFDARYGVNRHAMVWSGSGASAIDLNPARAVSSEANALFGNRQGGWARPLSGPTHAGLWSGTAASWADIHPAGWTHSIINSMYGDQQGGHVSGTGMTHACIWTGTAESFVDLHPAAATSSEVIAMSGTHQYGVATIDGHSHACAWSGTADSWVDLSPPGAIDSFLLGAFGNVQVGYVVDAAGSHSCMWSGTAESPVNLDSFLPPGAYFSVLPHGVWYDGRFTYVVGEARPTNFPPEVDRRRAILWTHCNADVNNDGTLTSADFFDFISAFFTNAPSADFNRDETITSQDFFDFLAAFFMGC
jgi:hypothetical protein